jgi:prolyl-tRNA synthetase
MPGKAGKSFVQHDQLEAQVAEVLQSIQASMFERALEFRRDHTFDPKDYNELKSAVEKGWAFSWWCGDSECETKVKDETKATTRCIPLDQEPGQGICIVCGKPATEKVIFGKAY